MSPCSSSKRVPFARLYRSAAKVAQLSCSSPIDAASPVIGAMSPIVAWQRARSVWVCSPVAPALPASSSSSPQPAPTTHRAASPTSATPRHDRLILSLLIALRSSHPGRSAGTYARPGLGLQGMRCADGVAGGTTLGDPSMRHHGSSQHRSDPTGAVAD